jgi:hypothetical protein
MGFKGTINTNGRPTGTPNKITAEVRTAFLLLLEKNIPQLQDDINSLEPFQRIKIIIELSKFVIPTIKAVELSTTDVQTDINPIIIQFHDRD